MRTLQSCMGCQYRKLLGLLLFYIIASVISWHLIKLISRMALYGECPVNATWVREISELLERPSCNLDEPQKNKMLAHCKITMDPNSQTVRMMRSLPVLTPWLAPIIWEGTFDTKLLNSQFKPDLQVGLTVFAVKKYVKFLQKLLLSAEKHFMVGRTVHYYIFTDQPKKVPTIHLRRGRSAHFLEIPADQPWQDISMYRMEALSKMAKDRFYNEVQYLVCVDVEMVFKDHVGVEILGELVATLHPGYFTMPRYSLPYEHRPSSLAYISPAEGDFYYIGAIFAGTVVQIYQLANACNRAIIADKSKGIEAVWHDESHLNRYLVRHKPTKVLSPEYMWDVYMLHGDLLKKKRILAVTKDHEEIRS
ncbi:histo-blood group ABO system transferase 2-like isoform X2 [Ambystoma mexicanum]|uniref:histo-blood group ABO system transferase 2-like isoform X2 n=1 Tax=Ambystoma mexicanum TaxID=8296 RepID=UPI0037E93BF9